ncbi:MAG: GNAT family N-acetyltransferase [Candidatus Aegiribacteria sp.]|nr:GNAT family N-acetyltransferase [Candidatus Aegiribacteria sp.]
MPVEIVGPVDTNVQDCERILRALPAYFGIEEALLQYLKDIVDMPVFFALLNGKSIGFLAINRHTKLSAEIHVMGVLPEEHRKGVGGALTAAAEQYLKSDGVKILEVKTLGESHPDKNYAGTRKFYLTQDFLPLEEIPDFWGKGLPTLFMVKHL